MTPIRRAFASLLGAQLGMAIVAVLEARHCAHAAGAKDPLSRITVVLWGVLSPVGIVAGLAAGLALLLLDPNGPTSPRAFAAHVRSEPVLSRSRTAAFAPLFVVGAFVWTVFGAQLARRLLSRGDPTAVGGELAFGMLALLVTILAVVLSAVAPLRRVLARGAGSLPQLVDPIVTGGVALFLVLLALAWGARSGDTGGEGSHALAIFGVLRRQELDLRPVFHLLAAALGAYVLPLLIRPRGSVLESALLALAAFLPLGLAVPSAKLLDDGPALSRIVERHAPLGRIALAVLRRVTDRDGDGAAATFGGGDCDDRDPKKNPSALDVPGNGVDEDCSGADTPAPEPRGSDVRASAAAQAPLARPAIPDDLNLILITIDTLRPDLGFLGYDLPVSPNLDRFAAKSAVFERAYAPSSYTGKSMGPMLIGKYPSETLRNGSHFNTYEPGNVFLAERLAKAGMRTLGAASHWYFLGWSGITQGFAEFDLSSRPPSGQGDSDTTVTSKELTDAALRMLAKKENTQGRFFMWVHYMDPHAQYMQHAGAPSFVRPGEKPSYVASQRALYDGEVWFTDKHVGRLLDAIEKAPFGERTAIVVTSDHGEAFAEHNMNWHGVELWESIVRVPLVVYVPGMKPRRIAERRGLVDLVPTALDLLNAPAPEPGELSGTSWMRDLFGPESEKPEPRDVYLDLPIGPYNGVRRALITGPGAGMKILHFGGTQYSVFDLSKDPGELQDLAGEAGVLDPLVQRLQAFRGGLKEIDVKPAPP